MANNNNGRRRTNPHVRKREKFHPCIMGEYLTRYMIAAPMLDQKAETVMNTFIDSFILEFGVPERVLTDQGTNFLSQTMDTLFQQLGIERF
jgi:hypothetical protein